MNADGSHKRDLTRRSGQDHAPAWSPDGRIAFASAHGSPLPRIWVMNTDGSHQRRLSRLSGEYPSWSPDGEKISFERNTFGRSGWDIWVMNADGSRAKPLLASQADEQGPAWSPNGKRIAFQSDRGAAHGAHHIWTAYANGSHARRLTWQFGERPVWSPSSAPFSSPPVTFTSSAAMGRIQSLSPRALRKNSRSPTGLADSGGGVSSPIL